MNPSIAFDLIGYSIVTRVSMDSLSGRYKVSILKHLMDDLGITQRILANSRQNEDFLKIWHEQTELAWKEGSLELNRG